VNVVVVNTGDGGGGAARVALDVSRCLRQRGHRVTFYCGTPPKQNDSINLMGTADWFLGRTAKRIGFADAFSFAAMRFLSRKEVRGADIIHFHNLHGFYFGMLSVPKIARNKPCVWTLHDFWALTGGCYHTLDCQRWKAHCGNCPQHGKFPMVGFFDTSYPMHYIKRKALNAVVKCGAIVTPCQWLRRNLSVIPGINTENVKIINNAVDMEVFNPLRRDAARFSSNLKKDEVCVLLVSANLKHPLKGMRHAITTINTVAKKISLTIVIVGGQDKEMIEQFPNIKVKWVGYLDNNIKLADCYAIADVLVFPSVAETFPLAVLEAMASGTPTVAFDVGGVGEQIVDGETGYLVPPENTEAMGNAIYRLLGDKECQARMRHNCRERAVRNYSLELFYQRHLSLYDDVLSHWRSERHKNSQR
jgi:glycosyltransferase involved in cell wall biosynthesis